MSLGIVRPAPTPQPTVARATLAASCQGRSTDARIEHILSRGRLRVNLSAGGSIPRLGRLPTGSGCTRGIAGSHAHCTRPCTSQGRHNDIPCSTDQECVGFMSCAQGACLLVCTQDDQCKQGYKCQSGASATGTFGTSCQAHDDCQDFCFSYSYCSRLCTGPNDTTSCPAGSFCDEHHWVCEPG
jgi:hypothetical protein